MKIKKNHSALVDTFIEESQWPKELEFLRGMLLDAGLEETIKWTMPTYMVNKKNLIVIAGFKKFVSIWFFQGVFLKDPLKVLVNASEGKTKAQRQWRFTSLREIKKNKKAIESYIYESIEHSDVGNEIKPRKKQHLATPKPLAEAFKADATFKAAFSRLSPAKKRAYKEYIAEAKREDTKLRRIKKILPMILDGQGLHDKYKP